MHIKFKVHWKVLMGDSKPSEFLYVQIIILELLMYLAAYLTKKQLSTLNLG